MPKGCDLVAAAALPVAFGTSHVALVHRANLTSSQAAPLISFIIFLSSVCFQLFSYKYFY